MNQPLHADKPFKAMLAIGLRLTIPVYLY